MKLSLGGKKYIIIPENLVYEGSLENRPTLFESQEKIIHNTLKDFEQFNITFDYFYLWNVSQGNKVVPNYVFLSKCRRIIFRKYDGPSYGSGNSYIYIDGIIYNRTEFTSKGPNYNKIVDMLKSNEVDLIPKN